MKVKHQMFIYSGTILKPVNETNKTVSTILCKRAGIWKGLECIHWLQGKL